MNSRFSEFHPIVNIVYFTVVLLISMFVMHPVIIAISLVMGIVYATHLKGVKKTIAGIRYMLFTGVFVAVVNPLFNHQGVTILAYFKNGNPLTLESMIYGVFMAVLLLTVILWFQCYNEIMTSDKFIYLFGTVAPHLSLVLSMALRFTTRFKHQYRQVRDAQTCIGKGPHNGNVIVRIRHLVTITSIMISWSMENSIETADSMKSRGYGLPGRTSYSIYRFNQRDGIALGCISILTVSLISAIMSGSLVYRYYPKFRTDLFQIRSIVCYVIFGIICNIPLIIDIYEERRWKYLQQNS